MEYTLALNDNDMAALNAVLGEMPMKIAAPFVQKLNAQIAEQQKGDTNGTN